MWHSLPQIVQIKFPLQYFLHSEDMCLPTATLSISQPPAPGVQSVTGCLCHCPVDVFLGAIAGGRSAAGRPGLGFKSNFPIPTGQGMFSWGWEVTAPSPLKTAPPRCFSLPRSCGVQVWLPRRIQKSQRARACQTFPQLATHTPTVTRGDEWGTGGKERASQVSNHIGLRAQAAGRDPWQFCLFGKTVVWPELTLSYLTANNFSPGAIKGRMTPGLRTDEYIKDDSLVSRCGWAGLSLLSGRG